MTTRVVVDRNGRKRRLPSLAPRYTSAAANASGDDDDNARDRDADGEAELSARDPRAAEMEQQNAELVREVFTSATCRCFVLKSFSEANFHKSLKFGIWSTTYAHNALLDQVFRSDLTAVRPVLFFFSVCGTKHFSGVARMTSGVRSDVTFQLWEKRKYEGYFHLEWLLVKDVPNYVFTGVKMSNTPSKKSITSCRDCEEVLFEEANAFLAIYTAFASRSSAWDDFAHFDTLQEKLEGKRWLLPALPDPDLASFLSPLPLTPGMDTFEL